MWKFFIVCRVYCLVGDGESVEGSIWEALHFASYYKLDNLCVIFDVNRLGQSEPTSLQHNMDVYRKRVDAFGCHVIVVDGHNVEELCKVLSVHSCLNDISFSLYLDFLPFALNYRILDATAESQYMCKCCTVLHPTTHFCVSPNFSFDILYMWWYIFYSKVSLGRA